jgi:hypothetical protein
MTPNRSAGRIEDPIWDAFLAKARAEGLSNTDAMRVMITGWTGYRDSPAPRGRARARQADPADPDGT